MIEHITISKQKPVEKSSDYNFLRQEGINYIERLGSKLWTDYNIHDPGITLLELLCYAITDLGYRASYPVEDLLATTKDNEKNFENQFYSTIQILPTRPVTEIDFRKLFIDIPEVKNAWLFKAKETLFVDKIKEQIAPLKPATNKQCTFDLNGLYNVKIEFHEAMLLPPAAPAGKEQRNNILEQVRKKFHDNRNLCEDLKSVTVIEEDRVLICADIEIDAGVKAEDVYAEILYAVQTYLSPEVNQYSLEQMVDMEKADGTSYSFDEIFNGPVLENGFIPDEEVINSKLRTTVYTSDLINVIMDIKGVVAIRNILLNYCKANDMNAAHEWCLPITPGKKATLCLDKTAIHFYKDVIPIKTSRNEAIKKFNEKIKQLLESAQQIKTTDRSFTKGQFSDADFYTSVIHHLPQTYGVSEVGLPPTATADRYAKARQLKAYLLFFDQQLANYLAQLANVRELFRLKSEEDIYSYLPKTYYSQKISGVTGIESIIKDYNTFDTTGDLPKIIESLTIAVDRKNRFLDHLLSRFAEQFSEYAVQLFTVYGAKSSNELIIDKSVFLSEYDVVSKNRSSGYNYYNDAIPVWDTENVSGMEHRIARLLGWADYRRRTISSLTFTGEITKTTNNGIDEFRFRIADENAKILLTSTSKYATEPEAEADLLLTMELASDSNNYSVKTAADGKFFFTVIRQDSTTIARRFEFFNTMAELYKALNGVIGFIKKKYSTEGMFVVEHILLRQDIEWLLSENQLPDVIPFLPVCAGDDCDSCDDPYSFRVSIVLPAQNSSFGNMNFREYTEKMIRLETPAHINPRICWVKNDVLKTFEEAYENWLELKRANQINAEPGQKALKELIKILFELRSSYPPGKLMDCEDEKKPGKPVITGRTNLGDL